MANARIPIVSILASCFLLTTTLTGCLVAGVEQRERLHLARRPWVGPHHLVVVFTITSLGSGHVSTTPALHRTNQAVSSANALPFAERRKKVFEMLDEKPTDGHIRSLTLS